MLVYNNIVKMSLYQVINNEALDEDQRIYRQVVERMKRNITDNKEKAKPQATLDTIQKNVIKKNFNIFERQLYKLAGYIEERNVSPNKTYDVGDVAEAVSNIILAYNNISAYLDSISYNKLYQGDKQFIDIKFTSYIPIIQFVINGLENQIDSSILAPLSDIIENIKLKNYKQSGYAIDELVEQAPRRQAKREALKIRQFAERFNTYAKIRGLSPAEAKKTLFDLTGEQSRTAQDAKVKLQRILDRYLRDKAEEEEQKRLAEEAQAPAPAEEEEEPEEEPEED